MPRSYLHRPQQRNEEAVSHTARGSSSLREEIAGPQGLGVRVTSWSSVRWHLAALWQLPPGLELQIGEGTQAVGHGTNGLDAEVTAGPCPSVWRGAGAGQDSTLCKVFSFSDPSSKPRSGHGHRDCWIFYCESRTTTAPHCHSGGLRPQPGTPGPPILYLVRECLPMRTRRSFSVKFLSQGG